MLVLGVGLGPEEIELLDQAREGIGSDLPVVQESLLDAHAIEERPFGNAVNLGQSGLDRLLEGFRGDLAGLALVGAGFVFQDRDAVLLIAAVPGFDRAPGEVARIALLIGEGHLAHRLDAVADRIAGRHVDGPEHAHFEIRSRIFHAVFSCWFLAGPRSQALFAPPDREPSSDGGEATPAPALG